MDYENAAKAQASGQLIGTQGRLIDAPGPTIAENIERRIEMHKAEIERLERTKAHLASGASMLSMRIDDLRQVMNY